MRLKEFMHSGNPKTLFSAFLYFDVSFMIWVMLGPLGNFIAKEFELSASQKGLMTATPILTGALLRLVLGPLADRIGARKTALIGLCLTLIPLLLGSFVVNSFAMVLVVGLLLGIAGGSFAVALPMASRWYPPEQQGLVMGIAGAGNSGTVITSLFAPRLAQYFGDWRQVFMVAIIPLAMAWLVVAFLAKDAPGKAAIKTKAEYIAVFKQTDTLRFSLLYGMTFGGFVGLASFLPIFFHDQYELAPVSAATFAAICVFAGSFLRPVGGYLADRFGGIRILVVLFAVISLVASAIGFLLPLFAETTLLFILMSLLGLGNGSVFQIVPLRFRKEIGVATGIVGAVGGLGGFLLPSLLGILKDVLGGYNSGFMVYSCAALACVGLILASQKEWQSVWAGEGGRARIQPVSIADSASD